MLGDCRDMCCHYYENVIFYGFIRTQLRPGKHFQILFAKFASLMMQQYVNKISINLSSQPLNWINSSKAKLATWLGIKQNMHYMQFRCCAKQWRSCAIIRAPTEFDSPLPSAGSIWGNSCIRRIFIAKMSITPKTWHLCCKMLSF